MLSSVFNAVTLTSCELNCYIFLSLANNKKKKYPDSNVIFATLNQQNLELLAAKNKTAASVTSDSLDTPIHVAAK